MLMHPEVQRGRRRVAVVLRCCTALFVLFVVLGALQHWPAEGQQRDVFVFAVVLGVILYLILCLLLYEGRNWARWAFGTLSLFQGICSLLGGVGHLHALEPDVLIQILIGCIYLGCVRILFFDRSVRLFFATARSRPWVSDL